MMTTRVMIHPATPAETDEALMTTLLGQGGGGRGGLQFSERILSSGSTG